MVKTIVIEDELPAQTLLCNIIREYCPNLQIVGMARNVKEAYDLIKKEDPDLAFMDIQLADDSSFNVLDLLPNRRCQVIFTTAYEQYALKAFKYEAIDYVMKPYCHLDIIQAVNKVKLNEIDPLLLQKISTLFGKKEGENGDKLKVPTSSGIVLLK